LTVNRLPKEYAELISEGRLLTLSPLGEKVKRARRDMARFRNEFAAALANRVFIGYAAPGDKIEDCWKKLVERGKSLLTFDCPENAPLIASGARPYTGPEALSPESS
jgi:hypothetical protein